MVPRGFVSLSDHRGGLWYHPSANVSPPPTASSARSSVTNGARGSNLDCVYVCLARLLCSMGMIHFFHKKGRQLCADYAVFFWLTREFSGLECFAAHIFRYNESFYRYLGDRFIKILFIPIIIIILSIDNFIRRISIQFDFRLIVCSSCLLCFPSVGDNPGLRLDAVRPSPKTDRVWNE